jgi:hypothetical protein
LISWRELASADTNSTTGQELRQQIARTFDLLCACDLGMSELGYTAHYAQKVVNLVKRYFYGSWRVGHIEDEHALSETDAIKELTWDDELRVGCAAATKSGDINSLRDLLRYPCQNVLSEYREYELAYHRLLSDVVRGRTDWNWPEQTALLEKSHEPRHPKLAACVVALREDDTAAFAKAIREFATKPLYVPPPMFSNAIDSDVTTVCGLAQQKGWPCDFPQRLQDKILDRKKLD